MKRIYIILVLLISLFLTGCSSQEEKNEKELIGYWMDEEGNALTFTGENCTYKDTTWEYSIYDKNRLQLKSSFLGEAKTIDLTIDFEDKEHLTLTETSSKKSHAYSKNVEEQERILTNVQHQKERAEAETERQGVIKENEDAIKYYQGLVDDVKMRIENNESDIENWKQNIQDKIDECEKAIAFGDDPEYQQRQRDEFIATYEESIKNCNERISELESQVKEYEAEIKSLEEFRDTVLNPN